MSENLRRYKQHCPHQMETSTITNGDTSKKIDEIRLKPTVQCSAKGPVCIDECSSDGKYIQLANTSTLKDVDLTGWCLLRKVDNRPEISFILPNNFRLDKRKTVKIYACYQDNGKISSDLVSSNFDTWGIGDLIVTRLLNKDSDEKAVHIQRFLK
ncbi:hypothetical protein I4U23_015107 [Adineta vaga]|nr:hypothetical protein I4U23_015107 [Adineta vaga]